MNRFIYATLIMLAAAVPLSAAFADVMPEPITNRGPNLSSKTKNCPVRMMWEVVDLYPGVEKNRVKAVFMMMNLGKKTAKLEVGFPSYFKGKLDKFECKVGGKKVLASIKKEKKYDPEDPENHFLARKGYPVYEYWMCWEMKFKPGRKKKIVVSYEVKTDDATRNPLRWINDVPEDLRYAFKSFSSGYILKTGAAWNGTIGKATVNIHYSDEFKKEYITELMPTPRSLKGWRIENEGWKYDKRKNIDTIVFEDVDPHFDISWNFRLADERGQLDLLFKAFQEDRIPVIVQKYIADQVRTNAKVLKLDKKEQEEYLVKIYDLATKRAAASVERNRLVVEYSWLRDVFRDYDKMLEKKGDTKTRLALAEREKAFVESMRDGKSRAIPGVWKMPRSTAGWLRRINKRISELQEETDF